ncbi:MAG: ATP-binding protein, partial [Bacteroidota bacterium]
IASLLEKRENPQEQELIDSLNFSSNNLMLLINDILDFSKLEAGKFTLDFQPVDFSKLLLNIKNTYNSLAKEKGLALNLKVISETSKVYLIDETRISQILGNLISNSIKFTDQGYVDIIVDKVDESDDSDIVRFKVIDSGTGIDKDYQKTIFDSFSQSKSVTKRKAGGSGLGLAIVKKLVELHNSRIHLISDEGRGSMFYFDLKLKKSRVIVKSKPKSSTDLAGKYILLAEDNMINAMVAKKLLSNWGIKTRHAKNGAEAFEMSKEELFDYILLDIHMPEMDGFEAVKLIRDTNDINCKTPIFALTADITVKNKEEYADYFNDFLLKPIEKDKLYNSLKTFQK